MYKFIMKSYINQMFLWSLTVILMNY